jgi:hypothetical protein
VYLVRRVKLSLHFAYLNIEFILDSIFDILCVLIGLLDLFLALEPPRLVLLRIFYQVGVRIVVLLEIALLTRPLLVELLLQHLILHLLPQWARRQRLTLLILLTHFRLRATTAAVLTLQTLQVSFRKLSQRKLSFAPNEYID